MPFSIDQGPDAGLDQQEGAGPLSAQDGDSLTYVRGDSGQDLTGGPGVLPLSLRPWITYVVGQGGLTADLAGRLLQDGVCRKL